MREPREAAQRRAAAQCMRRRNRDEQRERESVCVCERERERELERVRDSVCISLSLSLSLSQTEHEQTPSVEPRLRPGPCVGPRLERPPAAQGKQQGEDLARPCRENARDGVLDSASTKMATKQEIQRLRVRLCRGPGVRGLLRVSESESERAGVTVCV